MTPIVNPDDERLLPWTLLGAGFIVYEVLLMPYRFCFSAPPEGFFWYFENLLTTYFIVDVAFNFFIGYTTPRGDFVTNHSAVRWNYLKGWFLVDLVAALSGAVDWISIVLFGDISPDQAQAAKLVKTVRFLKIARLAKLARVAKLKKLIDRVEQELEGSSVQMLFFAIVQMLFILFFIGHVAGCFWFYIGITWQEHYGVSWLTEKMPSYDVDQSYQKLTNYLWSFHYSMATMTTVGYGDISPTNTAEVIYTYALLWVSLLVFSGCMGILMNMISQMYQEGQERRMRMIEITKYMQWRLLPRELRLCIRRYVTLAANRRFEVSKFKFEFPRARTYELIRACSRLYRSQNLQVNTRWKALVEIYKMHSFAPFWNRIPKTRKTMGRKEPGPTPGKNGREKLLCTALESTGEKWGKRAWPKQPRLISIFSSKIAIFFCD